ncbi:MAG: hypothetical protein ACRD9R_13675 [Pyrinomonadaceae bacterium]
MRQTFEAIIDTEGRVHLMEKVSVARTRRAFVTILEEVETEADQKSPACDTSIVGSLEILTDDLEGGDKEISRMFGDALKRSGENLSHSW